MTSVSSCGKLGKAEPKKEGRLELRQDNQGPLVRKTAPSNEGIYELKQDNQGRLIRLNKVTGEVAIIDGTELMPVAPADSTSSSGLKRVANSSGTGGARRRPAIQPPAKTVAAAPGDSSSAVAPAAAETVVTIGQAPVFGTPDQRDTPVTIAKTGASFKLLGIEGDWYHIEFDDPRKGPGVGFIAKKNAVLAADGGERLKPVDLTIPGLSPDPLEPVDLSIRDRK